MIWYCGNLDHTRFWNISFVVFILSLSLYMIPTCLYDVSTTAKYVCLTYRLIRKIIAHKKFLYNDFIKESVWYSRFLLLFSASHDKSLEIHWLTTPGLWNDSARRRGLSLFARKSYVPRRVVTSNTMRRRYILRYYEGESFVEHNAGYIWRMYQIKLINVMWCTKPINACFFRVLCSHSVASGST